MTLEDFSLIAVDVDGSLANPAMRVSVGIWAAILAVPMVFALLRARSKSGRSAVIFSVFLLGCVTSPFANRLIGMLIYQLISRPGTSVGLFGGPPFFASPIVALAIAGTAALIRRSRKTAPSP